MEAAGWESAHKLLGKSRKLQIAFGNINKIKTVLSGIAFVNNAIFTAGIWVKLIARKHSPGFPV